MAYQRVEILTRSERRRNYTPAEKVRIVEEAFRSGVIVKDMARRLGIHESLLYRWRRLMRAAPPTSGLPTFVPVMVTPEPDVVEQSTLPPAASPPSTPAAVAGAIPGSHAAPRSTGAYRGGHRSSSGGGRAAGVSDIGTGIMILVPTGVRVWLSTGHTDMRKGWASLALLVQERLGQDPHSGQLFIFRGRRGDLVKVIWHDSQGSCLFVNYLASYCISFNSMGGL
jgi:transposase-like protein